VAGRSGLSLTAQPDLRPILEPGRKLDIESLAASKSNSLILQDRCVLERHVEPIGHVRALARRRAPPSEAAEWAASPAGAAEQPFEQVRKVGSLTAKFEFGAVGATTKVAARLRTGTAIAERR